MALRDVLGIDENQLFEVMAKMNEVQRLTAKPDLYDLELKDIPYADVIAGFKAIHAIPSLAIMQGLTKGDSEFTSFSTYINNPSKENLEQIGNWAKSYYKDVLALDAAAQSAAIAKLSPREVAALGDHFLTGFGMSTQPDPHKALSLYRLAAERGDGFGHFRVGNFYQNGWIVEKDALQALKHYKAATASGFIPAYNYIAMITVNASLTVSEANGQGRVLSNNSFFSTQSRDKYHYYSEAAQKGYGPAFYELGLGHLNGLVNGKSNPDLARKYFAVAAMKGVPAAIFSYGKLLGGEEQWKFVRLGVSCPEARDYLWRSFSESSNPTPALIFHAYMALKDNAKLEVSKLKTAFDQLAAGQPAVVKQLSAELQDGMTITPEAKSQPSGGVKLVEDNLPPVAKKVEEAKQLPQGSEPPKDLPKVELVDPEFKSSVPKRAASPKTLFSAKTEPSVPATAQQSAPKKSTRPGCRVQ